MKLRSAIVVLVWFVVGCSDDGASPIDGGRSDGASVMDASEAPGVDRAPEAVAGDSLPDVSDGRVPREVPAAAMLDIQPAVHDFGNVMDNEVVTKHFKVTNIGGGASGALDIKLMNGARDPNAFDIVSNGCESTLEPEASCEIEIRFMANVLGAHQGLLTATASPGGMASAELKAAAVP